MDPRYGSRVVYLACEGEISYQRWNCRSEGRSASCKTVFSNSHQSRDQAKGANKARPIIAITGAREGQWGLIVPRI